ncbi:MAG TPA: gliding motility-associated C-terminal domain-containing protein [Bacteroidales bacterium]|nr:gliding motility-associated C-terminal domain-containing protein [Bacteroidales bacterium]
MDFEDSIVATPGHMALVNQSFVPCWSTTATDGLIEVWGTGFNGVPAYSGNQFIELNANMVSTLYQNFYAGTGANVIVSFAHRGRSGVDSMSVSIGPVGGTYTTLGTFGDGNTAWGYYTLSYVIPSMGNYSLRFNSVYATGGVQSVGNFLDFINISLPTVTATISSGNVSCNSGSNGSATVVVTTGLPPYSYSWAPTGDSTSAINNLAAGYYSCTVTDANGCTTVVGTSVTEPSSLSVSVQASNAICNGDSSGYAMASASGGTPPYTYFWSNNQTTPTAIWLLPGTYTVTITDSAGCSTTAQALVSVNGNPSTTASVNSPVCAGQDINLTTTGGLSDSYHWSGPDGFSSSLQHPSITGAMPLASGMYSVTVTDASGCVCSAQVYVTVNENPVAAASANTPVCTGQNINLTSVNGNTYSYLWSGPDGFSSSLPDPSITGVTDAAAGAYFVTVTDIKGCSDSASVNITVLERDSGLVVPNVITPNGDGYNDIFKVELSSRSEIEGLIYNRWGNLICRWEDPSAGWDGTYNGKSVPSGVYMYVIVSTDECGYKFNKSGTVTVIK